MPAAAVIPAPLAYANSAAVKTLVVEFWLSFFGRWCASAAACCVDRLWLRPCAGSHSAFGSALATGLNRPAVVVYPFTLNKLECSKQAIFALNTLAWNNKIGLQSYFVGFQDRSND